MKLLRWSFGLVLIVMLSACGQIFAPPVTLPTVIPTEDSIVPSGKWSLSYMGDCSAREAESLDVTITEDGAIVFDDYTLTLNDDGEYVGSAQFTAPMPADGRDIVFITEYRLTQEDRTTFAGVQSVEEVGKGSEPCPVRLVYIGGS